MRIGLFVDVFFPMIDGVIQVVNNYANRLLDCGAEVTVFCPQSSSRDFIDDFPYKVVRCKSLEVKFIDYDLPTPNADRRFIKTIDDSNLDIIHIHSPFTIGKLAVNYAKKHNLPIVATMHSQYRLDFERSLKVKSLVNAGMRYIMSVFNACDECWAVNSEIKTLYIDEYGLTAPCIVQDNCTELLPLDNPIVAAQTVNTKYNLKDDDIVLLFVGRINFLKNLDFLVRSLSVLKEKGFSFKMLFFGNGQDEDELSMMIHDLNLDDCTFLCGRIDDRQLTAEIYSRADLFVFPSLYDANSIVQIEAASQKTPTLFLRGAKTAGTVTENVNGYFSEADETSYADKIIEIFSDKEKYAEISSNAFRDLYKNWDTVIKKVYSDYERLIEQKKTSTTES